MYSSFFKKTVYCDKWEGHCLLCYYAGLYLFPLSSIPPFVGGIPEALQNTLQIIEFYVYIKFSIIRKSVFVAKFDFLGVLGSCLACLTRKQIDEAYSIARASVELPVPGK